MHDVEDLLFSFNGKIIVEGNSNLASCTHVRGTVDICSARR